MQADLILYALVAAGLVFWLRSVLGTRNGSERERPNPFVTGPSADKPGRDLAPAVPAKDGLALPIAAQRPALPRNVTLANGDVEAALIELARQDRDFTIANFAQGAQDAFVLIVEAFAGGDRATLKPLLEPAVYSAFDAAISEREARKETVSTEIHAVRKVEILSVTLVQQTASVMMRFIADETCVVKNADGAVIQGDPDRITEMNDIWTFNRAMNSKSPVWRVGETSDGDVKDEIHLMPDAG